mmetsp:Transcript_8517/g.28038  ORF Transcript_8517/g.28038 Transcript_8517/m.28038 type:complete len:207 (-) Transcript_8517:253-873(-)
MTHELVQTEVVAADVEAGARNRWGDQHVCGCGDDIVHMHHVDRFLSVKGSARRSIRRQAGADTPSASGLAKDAGDGEDGGASAQQHRVEPHPGCLLQGRLLIHRLPRRVHSVHRRGGVSENLGHAAQVGVVEGGGILNPGLKRQHRSRQTLRRRQVGPCLGPGQVKLQAGNRGIRKWDGGEVGLLGTRSQAGAVGDSDEGARGGEG